MSVLLGLRDETILKHHVVDWTCNKTGGEPVWIYAGGHSPACQGCCAVMRLTCQLYCPLERSAYHRALYIFTCRNRLCRGKSYSWVVLRCQVQDEGFKGCDQSMVQEQSHDHQSDQFSALDWCSSADDWGDDSELEMLPTSETVSYCDKGDHSEQNTSGTYANGENSRSAESSEVVDFSHQMKQMNIEDIADSAELPMDNDVSDSNEPINAHIISEDQQPSHETVDNMLDVLAGQSSNSESPVQGASEISASKPDPFIPYFLNVVEEPTHKGSSDSKHIQKLLREYERKEGSGYREEFSDERSPSGGGEKYEKADLRHGDPVFHKFTKRLSRCPQQCIRYEWNGTPLFMSQMSPSILSTAVPPCPLCGESRVFELQLMPALVHALKTDSDSSLVEFGTVLIYTCRGSCWQDGDTCIYKEEVAMVIQDPDQHLFK